MIIFRSKCHRKDYDISIKLDGIKRQPKDSVKYLGMFVDKHLAWNVQINQLSKKLGRANGILSKLRHNDPKKVCLHVYHALFHSHLIYGCNVWGLTNEENLKTIEILQKKCM